MALNWLRGPLSGILSYRRTSVLNVHKMFGCSFFFTVGKLSAYSGACSLTIDNFSFLTYSWSFFTYNFSLFPSSWRFFAYSGSVRLISALRDCKQRSLAVSERAPTVSQKSFPPPSLGAWLIRLGNGCHLPTPGSEPACTSGGTTSP